MLCSFRARFAKHGKLARDRNPTQVLMEVEVESDLFKYSLPLNFESER